MPSAMKAKGVLRRKPAAVTCRANKKTRASQDRVCKAVKKSGAQQKPPDVALELALELNNLPIGKKSAHGTEAKKKDTDKVYQLQGGEICANVDGEWTLRVQLADRKPKTLAKYDAQVKLIEQSVQRHLNSLTYHRRMFHQKSLPSTCFFGKDWGPSGSKHLTSEQDVIRDMARLESECKDYIDVIFSDGKEPYDDAEEKPKEIMKMKRVFQELRKKISAAEGHSKMNVTAVVTRLLDSKVKGQKDLMDDDDDNEDCDSLVAIAEDATEPTDFGHWEAKADLALHLFNNGCLIAVLTIKKAFRVACS